MTTQLEPGRVLTNRVPSPVAGSFTGVGSFAVAAAVTAAVVVVAGVGAGVVVCAGGVAAAV